jgi:hypothetical protein
MLVASSQVILFTSLVVQPDKGKQKLFKWVSNDKQDD